MTDNEEKWLDWFEREVAIEGDLIERSTEAYLPAMQRHWDRCKARILELQRDNAELEKLLLRGEDEYGVPVR